jgi:hypothetical protein
LHEASPLRTNLIPYRELATGPDDWRYVYDKIPIERMLLEEPTFQTTSLRLPYNFAQYWSIDASHFRQTTGFSEPFHLKESLRRTVAWLRANPPEPSAQERERWRQEDNAEDQVLARV